MVRGLVPGGGFGGPGGGFNVDRSSGKPLLLLRLKSHPPGPQKPAPGPPEPPVYSLLAPRCTSISRLGVVVQGFSVLLHMLLLCSSLVCTLI